MVEVAPLGVKSGEPLLFVSVPLKLLTTMSYGSISQVPPLPISGSLVMSRKPRLEVSTNPPLPLIAPRLALIEP